MRSTDALDVLAQALQGRGAQPLRVQRPQGDAASGDGGNGGNGDRPVLTPSHLLLPSLDAGLERAAVAHAVAHLLYSTPDQDARQLKPMSQVVMGAIEDARVEHLLMQLLPGTRAWFTAPLRAACRADSLSLGGLLSRLDLALHEPLYGDGSHWVSKARQLFEQARRQHGLQDARAFRALGSVLAHELGQMRVRFEGRHFQVPAPYRDDHSYLWVQEAASTDPPLEKVAEPTTIARSGGPGQASPSRAMVCAYRYPEWHARMQLLLENWCTVLESAPAYAPALHDALAVAPARLPRQRHQPTGRARRRLSEGEQLDLDAAIEHGVQRRQGRLCGAEVFQRRGLRFAPRSLLILVDSSESTSQTHVGQTTLLDLECNAALMLARHLNEQGHVVAVHAFNSDTRERVHYQRVLDFGAGAQDIARAMSLPLRGQYSTRMGAALRHASHCLRAAEYPNPALLILTDGEPGDIDVHDPMHLVEDARHAVQDARRAGLGVEALVMGEYATAKTARHIFGRPQTSVVSSPDGLYRALHRICNRLTDPACAAS